MMGIGETVLIFEILVLSPNAYFRNTFSILKNGLGGRYEI